MGRWALAWLALCDWSRPIKDDYRRSSVYATANKNNNNMI